MVRKTHLWREDTIETDGQTTVGVTIERPEHKRKLLWYRVPAEYGSFLTKTSEPFVLSALFGAMHEATDLYVHGQVSPSLLQNLEEFQQVWSCWRPDRYTRVEIKADVERDQPETSNSDGAIVAFSGGVDSCFTAWRHCTGSCGRLRRNLGAAVLVHGFDIPIEEKEAFNRVAEKSNKMLEGLSIEMITIATNFRQLGDDWGDAHGAAVASCLMLLQTGYGIGLIASTEPYNGLVLPWGSNPISDGLLSSDAFQTVHDGAAFTRSDKIRELLNWPEALQYLRVCWQGKQRDRNCSRCEKCIRTILNFRSIGLALPECFEHDVSDSQILALKGLNLVQIAYLDEILAVSRAASIAGSWVAALEKCIKQNRHMAGRRKRFWRRMRKTVALRTRLRRLTSSKQKTPNSQANFPVIID